MHIMIIICMTCCYIYIYISFETFARCCILFYESGLCSDLVACPPLTEPDNSELVLDGVLEGSTASYSCNTGYDRIGPANRICGVDGSWSGSEPSCQSKCCRDALTHDSFDIINPRRACAARVTVVVLCVCLSVCLRLFSDYGLRGGS